MMRSNLDVKPGEQNNFSSIYSFYFGNCFQNLTCALTVWTRTAIVELIRLNTINLYTIYLFHGTGDPRLFIPR